MNRRFSSLPYFIFLIALVQLLGLAACFHKDPPPPKPADPAAGKVVVMLPEKKIAAKDQQLQRLARYLEQADAVHREAWWVVANERKVQGKSIFGKAQRALLGELNVKLSNKNVFSCDRYLVKREISSALGLPQKGELMEKCSSKADATRFAEFELNNTTEADVYFYPQHLADVVGIATSILNRKVHCHFKGDEEGKLSKVSCKNLAQDRNSTQSIQFSVYDYEKDGKNLITLKGQVYENLSPVRKIEAQVPMVGKIEVTETQTEAPEVVVIPPAPPETTATLPADGVPTAVERPHRDREHPAPNGRGVLTIAPPAQQSNIRNARPVRPRNQPAADTNSGEIVETQNPQAQPPATHPDGSPIVGPDANGDGQSGEGIDPNAVDPNSIDPNTVPGQQPSEQPVQVDSQGFQNQSYGPAQATPSGLGYEQYNQQQPPSPLQPANPAAGGAIDGSGVEPVPQEEPQTPRSAPVILQGR